MASRIYRSSQDFGQLPDSQLYLFEVRKTSENFIRNRAVPKFARLRTAAFATVLFEGRLPSEPIPSEPDLRTNTFRNSMLIDLRTHLIRNCRNFGSPPKYHPFRNWQLFRNHLFRTRLLRTRILRNCLQFRD
ncbi:hypothetical protein LXL04_021646 [Taraxacum kok-saghyz]